MGTHLNPYTETPRNLEAQRRQSAVFNTAVCHALLRPAQVERTKLLHALRHRMFFGMSFDRLIIDETSVLSTRVKSSPVLVL